MPNMSNQKRWMIAVLIGTLCGVTEGCNESGAPASNAPTATRQPTTAERRDAMGEPADRTNTGVNVRDRNSTAKTPLDQKENKPDLQITADIRKRVVGEKLSSEASNVKIITQDGRVTLRGPVKTEQEKQKIEEIALAVAGADNVDSQLEVAAK